MGTFVLVHDRTHVDASLDGATLLWQYLDLAKFVALLDARALHLTRADHLGDLHALWI